MKTIPAILGPERFMVPNSVRVRTLGPFLAVISLLAVGLAPGEVWPATGEMVARTALRVCADPHNLPYSNKAGEGFENKIAELFAKELGLAVQYTWYPQSSGFIRRTLNARRCDIVIGIPAANGMVQNTNPYYRSTYVMVYRSDSGIDAKTLGDAQLKSLRIGVVARTPPAGLLARYGLMDRVRPYHLVVDTRYFSPAKKMVEDVAAGEIDVGVLWGPIAGYHAKGYNPALTLVLLHSVAGSARLEYRITMGIRRNEPDWKHKLNAIIEKKQAEINAIIKQYGIPMIGKTW